MPLADANGPRWVRQQKLALEKRHQGLRPVRDFVAAVLGRFFREKRGRS